MSTDIRLRIGKILGHNQRRLFFTFTRVYIEKISDWNKQDFVKGDNVTCIHKSLSSTINAATTLSNECNGVVIDSIKNSPNETRLELQFQVIHWIMLWLIQLKIRQKRLDRYSYFFLYSSNCVIWTTASLSFRLQWGLQFVVYAGRPYEMFAKTIDQHTISSRCYSSPIKCSSAKAVAFIKDSLVNGSITWTVCLSSSVCILSATLNISRRQRLLCWFHRVYFCSPSDNVKYETSFASFVF